MQNRWATEAVFLMLDDEPIKSRLGRFSLADCARLWSSPAYADMQLELLALMEKFELCYRLQDARPDTWLVPQMLCPSTPLYVQDWAQASDLVLRYRYEFLPRGLLSRLQVRMHRYVDPQRSWANGALFEQGETQLLAHVSDRGEEITLRARGPESKALLSIIASAIDALNDSFPGLEGRVSKWIPCTCSACSQSTAPELFEQKRLLQRKRDGKQTIECPESYVDVSVLGLLDGLQVERPPSDVAPPVHGNGPSPTASSFEAPRREKTIKVFLASSNETRADRDEFEIYFRQQNDRLRNQGLYIEIVRWENFLNAMSKTRLQDEYNKKVRAADLFVCLFMTKAGAYTEEEFDVAYRSFRDTGKPRIFTFFKEAQVSTSAANREGLNSLWAFQKKLDGLGHFHTTYESAAHLNLLFKDQLERLLEQDEI